MILSQEWICHILFLLISILIAFTVNAFVIVGGEGAIILYAVVSFLIMSLIYDYCSN